MATEVDRSHYSYTAASTFPLKLMLHEDLIRKCLKEHKVFPVHLQLNPTNRCPFQCSFCSCSARDRELELSLKEIEGIMDVLTEMGLKSVTITGGGEPLSHQDPNEMISIISDRGIQIGLVTNGYMVSRLSKRSLGKLVWVRVSASPEVPFQLHQTGSSVKKWLSKIGEAASMDRNVDWAFSFVLTERAGPLLVKELVEFANHHDFTHIRVVSDILKPEAIMPAMQRVRACLEKAGMNDGKVQYQHRADYSRGWNPCYISLLKPVIGADGYLYPCCGTQYALANPSRDYEWTMRMGHWKEVEDLCENQKFFDGSLCVKCYYSGYNQMLSVMLNGLDHKDFV